MRKLFFILIAVATVFSACKKSEVEDVYNPTDDGLVGNWVSKGADVAIAINKAVNQAKKKLIKNLSVQKKILHLP